MLSAGKYFIGNLSDVLTKEEFAAIDCENDGEYTLSDDRKIAIYTAHDLDYCFWDLQGRCYVMNYNSTIGCIKVEDIRKENVDLSNGHVIEFDEEFETETNGLDICFGRIIIQTESEEEEEYEDDEEIIEDDDDDCYDDEGNEDE